MNALEKQEGGTHYKDLPIQPVEFCQRNGLGFCESSVVKYVTRHREKGAASDIHKAIHFLELLLELEYPKTPEGMDGSPVEHPESPHVFNQQVMHMGHVANDLAVFMVKNNLSELGPIQLRK